MSYDLDPYYLTALDFVKRFSDGYDREEGYLRTFANSMADKAGIAQRNTIITLLIQTLQKIEKLEQIVLQLQNKDIDLDIEKLTSKLSSSLKIGSETSKKKKHLPTTFFMYTPENLKS